MKIALAQINPKIGALKANLKKIIEFINKSGDSDIIVFPELCITGYPPRDLLDFDSFVDDNIFALQKIIDHSKDKAVVCGFIDKNPDKVGKKYFNTAAFICDGEIIGRHNKCLLPFYDVFDETRYFEAGKTVQKIKFKGKTISITVCEDLWNDKDIWHRPLYSINPADELEGSDIIINISASPYWLNKEKERFEIFSGIAKKNKAHLIYVNQVGANDDLLFDGASFVFDPKGNLKALAPDFAESLVIYDTEKSSGKIANNSKCEEESLTKALTLGLKDYCAKVGFKKVILGLSGGIDSSLTAAIAVRALGSKNVTGITMPSMYSSKGSVEDSEKLARNLDIKCLNRPITDIFNSYIDNLQQEQGIIGDLAEENLQARIRANILMMYSNRFGYLLLSTGNKSELSVGYCTLYGDMAGGLNLLADVPKDMVYKLSNYINSEKEIIPQSVITKPPSAELRPNQTDQDTLPPYEILDCILKAYVEENKTADEISKVYPGEIVVDIIKKINSSEYKRRQATLGLKVTSRAFGSGRRFPIVQGYDFRMGKYKLD
jgi:NAD+ synthase (glutamine-hydrolysing)